MNVLETRALKKYYGEGETQVRALDGVDLTVAEGEFVAIVGTSGSGKSTLLHMLGGLDEPTSGKVLVEGKDIFQLKKDALTIFRMNTGFGIVSEAYLTEHADELAEASEQIGSQVGLIQCDVTFSNGINIGGKLRAMAEKAGLAEEVEWNENWAYVGAGITDWTSIGAVAGLLLLIMLTGYLIICNIFQISVMQDIRYYGLLKTIGTTAKQIRRILRRQALVMCGFGIPVGLVLGFLLGTAFTPLILQMTNTVDEVKLALNPAVFLGAAAFSVITVLLSMRKPARLAAKVSPVEAARYTEGNGKTAKKAKRSTSGGKLWRMALSNVGRNKRRAVLVILSMSLSLVLMNSVFTLTDSFDMDKYLARFIKTDFVVANARYWGIDSFRALDG